MTARERVLALLRDPPPPDAATGPWLDLVGDDAGPRGRLQEAWQSEGGAGGYDGVLGLGDRLDGYLPALLGGAALRTFYRVDERLRLRGGETVLDLACGPGTLTRRLARAVGRSGLVVATDLSVPMLTRAARSTPYACVDFLRADAVDLPLRDDAVDAVACSLCLHLVDDLGAALDEITRVLRPGGRVAITVPAHAPGPLRPLSEVAARVGQARWFAAGELAEALRARGWSDPREQWLGTVRVLDARGPV